MDASAISFAIFAAISCGYIVFLHFQIKSEKNNSRYLLDHYRKLEASSKAEIAALKKVPTYNAQQLLHDLTAGDALIRIQRLGPSDYMVRSPKG